ncbi:MAG: hypothetical protein ABDH20_10765 [Thermus sp.]
MERWDLGAGPRVRGLAPGERLHRYARPTGEGQKKLFQVRTIYTDLAFLDEFLTPEFALRQRLIAEDLPGSVKAQRPFSSTSPTGVIRWWKLLDANHANRGLALRHASRGCPWT